MEAVRLSGLGVCREATVSETIKEDDGRRVSVHAGDRVLVRFVRVPFLSSLTNTFDQVLTSPFPSSLLQTPGDADSAHFSSPDTVDPSRPLDSYLYPGPEGPHFLLGRKVFLVALTEMFRAVFQKSNVRRTPGPQGELKKIATSGGFSGTYLTEDWSSVTPLPTSMRVCWDE